MNWFSSCSMYFLNRSFFSLMLSMEETRAFLHSLQKRGVDIEIRYIINNHYQNVLGWVRISGAAS